MEQEAPNLLELFIITYNRSPHLDNTLRQLVGCPFSQFSITVLDNCSTDNTSEIYLEYKIKFPDLRYVKNKINIGADANVLRAAELSDGEYTWILCDDDDFNFSQCEDVLSEIEKGEADAIIVGGAQDVKWPISGLRGTPKDLLSQSFPYFCVTTFVPSNIFKTNLFQAQIRDSYINIVNLLPAMTYYIKLQNQNGTIYVSKNKVVIAMSHAEPHYSYIRVMIAVINTYKQINSVEIRRKAFYDLYLPRPNTNLATHAIEWYKDLARISLTDKLLYFRFLKLKEKLLVLPYVCIAPLLKRIKYSIKK